MADEPKGENAGASGFLSALGVAPNRKPVEGLDSVGWDAFDSVALEKDRPPLGIGSDGVKLPVELELLALVLVSRDEGDAPVNAKPPLGGAGMENGFGAGAGVDAGAGVGVGANVGVGLVPKSC